jgi:thiol:disulfide interchange protein
MIAIASSNRCKEILSTIAFLTFVASGSIIGCKSNPSETSSTPTQVAVNSEATPERHPVTPVPAIKKHLYSAEADPKAEIASALKQAGLEHKRIILDFGGDWCGDCQVLDIYFHQSPNADLLDKNFIVVHVDIGHYDKNLDVAEKYKIPLKKGVPALAVVDANGKLLYSQETGEFEDMRYMYPNSVTDFLNRWKA